MRITNHSEAAQYGLITPFEIEEFLDFLENPDFFDAFNPSFTHEGQPYQDWTKPSEKLRDKYEPYLNDRGEFVYVLYHESDRDRFFRDWEAEQQ